MRPDLFDPHRVHFHGFPNAAADLRRRARWPRSPSTWGAAFTYYYKVVEPGHLHVPLPRGGHGAHADGHARQPLRPPEAGRLPDGTDWAASPHTTSTPTTTATARPATTCEYPDPDRRASTAIFHDAAPRHPAAALRRHEGRLPHAQRPRLPGHDQPARRSRAPSTNGDKASQKVELARSPPRRARRSSCASPAST